MKKTLIIIILLSTVFLVACEPQDTGKRATLGSPTASIVIDEFSDFECPACANVFPELEKVIKNNTDIAQLNFYHFPLSYHKYSFMAAEASECANDQDKFWEYAKILFENQKSLTEDNLKSYAANLGLDTAAFDTCLDNGTKKARVKSDLYEGQKRQLSYTPSIYVNGQLIQWTSAEEFERYIKSL